MLFVCGLSWSVPPCFVWFWTFNDFFVLFCCMICYMFKFNINKALEILWKHHSVDVFRTYFTQKGRLFKMYQKRVTNSNTVFRHSKHSGRSCNVEVLVEGWASVSKHRAVLRQSLFNNLIFYFILKLIPQNTINWIFSGNGCFSITSTKIC